MSCLTQDQELPVKVEAAVALQNLIKHQELAEQVIKPYVKPIVIGKREGDSQRVYVQAYIVWLKFTMGKCIMKDQPLIL